MASAKGIRIQEEAGERKEERGGRVGENQTFEDSTATQKGTRAKKGYTMEAQERGARALKQRNS
jgi:hypothetical protein